MEFVQPLVGLVAFAWDLLVHLDRHLAEVIRDFGPWVYLILFLVIAFGYGLFTEVSSNETRITANLVIVVSLMHFWYDGFIWSVRKSQV